MNSNKNQFELPASQRLDYDPNAPIPDYSSMNNMYWEHDPEQQQINIQAILDEESQEGEENPEDIISALDETKLTNSQNNDLQNEEQRVEQGSVASIEAEWDVDKEQLKQIEVQERVKNSEYFYLLQNLLDSGWIDKEQFAEIQEQLWETTKDEEKQIVKSFIEENVAEWKAKTEALAQIDKKEDEFNSDNFKDSQFSKDSKDFKELTEMMWEEASNVDIMLANNYVSIENKNKEDVESWEWEKQLENKERDLASAMDTVKNKIVLNQTEDFKKLNSYSIKKIEEAKNLGDKYVALKHLNELVSIDKGKLWWEEKEKSSLEARKRQLIEDDYRLEERYKSLKKSWKMTTELEAQMKEEALQIIKESKEIQKTLDGLSNKWEAYWNKSSQIDSLSWWKNDKENKALGKKESYKEN